MQALSMLRAPGLALATSLLLALACGGADEPATTPATEGDETPSARSAEADEPRPDASLAIVAESERRWTGVAVDGRGRVFVNYPRWSDDVPTSVAVLDEDGTPRPFPDARWNECAAAGGNPERCWVCVQSVHVDARGDLWVLDPGNPRFQGVVDGAPKLVRFALSEDPATTELAQLIPFREPTITRGSYLNDVRVDLERGLAFLTDSGDGALVVVDLERGESRRLLDDHPSTQAEPITLTIGGRPFESRVHADGLAWDASSGTVYYQALTGRTLYAVPADALADAGLDDAALAAQVRAVGETGASDGLLFAEGRVLTTALERDAIRAVDPTTGAVRDVVRDARIAWPDSMARGPRGDLFFTTAQIHLGDDPPDPFRVWRLPAAALSAPTAP